LIALYIYVVNTKVLAADFNFYLIRVTSWRRCGVRVWYAYCVGRTNGKPKWTSTISGI